MCRVRLLLCLALVGSLCALSHAASTAGPEFSSASPLTTREEGLEKRATSQPPEEAATAPAGTTVLVGSALSTSTSDPVSTSVPAGTGIDTEEHSETGAPQSSTALQSTDEDSATPTAQVEVENGTDSTLLVIAIAAGAALAVIVIVVVVIIVVRRMGRYSP
ncbi:podoplanin [Lepisosteus oculatus]|uniref:podoplanin n=1 Tax=Lepisosteus oculatus TaxID=7918 RepID=UPI00370FE293